MESQPQYLLRILEGPHKGTRVPVREGLTIGRKEGDLIVSKDPKMSIQHARIEWRETEWVLVDLGSSNKIKVDGERYAEVVLYPELQLVMGSTQFEVLEKPRATPRPSPDAVPKSADEVFEFTGSVEVSVEALTWREILSTMIAKNLDPKKHDPNTNPGDKNSEIRPFPYTVRLEFITGVQHGTVWNLGYGPREAGTNSFDLPLFDEAATDSCFLLDTAGGKLLFSAAPGARVQLNGANASVEPVELQSGDRIEIGKTRIRVSLDN